MNPSNRLTRYGWRAVDPARRPVLFVNPTSGGGKAARAAVAERARDRGIDAVVLRAGRSRTGARRCHGEAADLSPPLRFAIQPAALRVRISSRHPGVSPAGLPP